MANMNTRIERCSDRLVRYGLRLKDLAAGNIVDERLSYQFVVLADELLDEAVRVEDVALDVAVAKQVLTLGRDETPNRILRERDEKIEMLKSLRAKPKPKAPSNVVVDEASVKRQQEILSIPTPSLS